MPRQLQELPKLSYCQTRFSDDRSKCAFRDLLVIRDNRAAVRRLRLPQHHVAPLLTVERVPAFGERLDDGAT